METRSLDIYGNLLAEAVEFSTGGTRLEASNTFQCQA